MKSDNIRILLADDHKIFRDGLASMFGSSEEITIAGVASNGKETLIKTRELNPDIILLDLSMPETGGLEVLKELQKMDIKPGVLVLSMHSEIAFILEALGSGANGYVSKEDTDREELTEAMKAVHRGESYFGKSIRQQMQQHLVSSIKNAAPSDPEGSVDLLTKREKEILRMVMEGMSNQEIADAAFVSIRTIETHKNNIMTKLNLKNTVELVKYAIRHKLTGL